MMIYHIIYKGLTEIQDYSYSLDILFLVGRFYLNYLRSKDIQRYRELIKSLGIRR